MNFKPIYFSSGCGNNGYGYLCGEDDLHYYILHISGDSYQFPKDVTLTFSWIVAPLLLLGNLVRVIEYSKQVKQMLIKQDNIIQHEQRSKDTLNKIHGCTDFVLIDQINAFRSIQTGECYSMEEVNRIIKRRKVKNETK